MAKINFKNIFSAQQAAIDALVLVGNSALASAERIAALNLHAVHEAMVDFSQNAAGLMQAKSPQDVAAWQKHLSAPQVQKSVLYSRSLYEISTAAQEDAVRLIEAQYNGFMASMSELANQIAQATPVGAEAPVAVIRSSMQAASDAFARFNNAVMRFTEVTEDSVSTMGNATVKAATGKAASKRPAPGK